MLIQKLKIILQSNFFLFLFVLFTILLIVYKINLDSSNSFIDGNGIDGYLNNYYLKDNKVTMEIKAKEKVIVYYYLSEGELFDYNLGDKINLVGNLAEANGATNFNLFNYKNYT